MRARNRERKSLAHGVSMDSSERISSSVGISIGLVKGEAVSVVMSTILPPIDSEQPVEPLDLSQTQSTTSSNPHDKIHPTRLAMRRSRGRAPGFDWTSGPGALPIIHEVHDVHIQRS